MGTVYIIFAVCIALAAVIRFIMTLLRRRARRLPAAVAALTKDAEQMTVYYEKGRFLSGALCALVGLLLMRSITYSPVLAFSGKWLIRAVPGALLLILGTALIFSRGGGCVAITDEKVVLLSGRMFLPDQLLEIPGTEIDAVCRVSAGKGGAFGAFFRLLRALTRADTEQIRAQSDAFLHNGRLSVISANKNTYSIRLINKILADEAIGDIAALCRSGKGSGEEKTVLTGKRYTAAYLAAAFAFALTLMILVPLNAKAQIEKRYTDALEKAQQEAYGAVYSEFAGLWDIYKYKDSGSWAAYCEAMTDLRFEKYADAAERFSSLGDFRDCRKELYACAVGMEEGSGGESAKLYASLGDFSDSDIRLKAIDERYNEAAAAYDKGDLAAAAAVFGSLRDYADTPSYVRLLCQAADELVPSERNHENLSNKEILDRCKKAQPILKPLEWDGECAEVLAICENYIYIYE